MGALTPLEIPSVMFYTYVLKSKKGEELYIGSYRRPTETLQMA